MMKTKDIASQIKWAYIASFLDLFGVSLILPSVSAHIRSLGTSFFMIGLMTSTYALAQLIAGPIIGSWSDKIGRRNIFITLYAIVACCYSIFGLATSIYTILILRALIGMFKHGQMIIQTIIKDQIPVDEQSLYFGKLKSIAGISFTVGPIIGGHIAEWNRGFTYLCFFCGFLLFVNSLIGYFCFEETLELSEKREPFRVNGFAEAISNLRNMNWTSFGDVFMLKFLLSLSAGFYHTNYIIRTQERFNISSKISGYSIAFQSFVGLVVGFMTSRITERFYKNDLSYKRRNFHGFLGLIAGYIGVYYAHNFTLFLLFSAVLKGSHMFLRIVLTDMLMRKCLPTQTGSLSGSSDSVASLARLITPLIAGFMEDSFGHSSTNLLAIVVAAVATLITFRIDNHHLKAR